MYQRVDQRPSGGGTGVTAAVFALLGSTAGLIGLISLVTEYVRYEYSPGLNWFSVLGG
ncbi:hypothetical protein [Nocardia sp. NPDC058666]|uniref:hypothetical protein n=1 Tax=unclassified Nocardia TaxID=2637762 RepID=UPI00365FA53A